MGKKKITLGFYESSLCKFRIIWIVLVLLRMSMLSKQKFRTFQLLKALVEKKKKKKEQTESSAFVCKEPGIKAATVEGINPGLWKPAMLQETRASPKCKCLQRKGIVQEKYCLFKPEVHCFSIIFLKLFFWPQWAHGLLVPRPGIEPEPLALEANHWTSREVSWLLMNKKAQGFPTLFLTDNCYRLLGHLMVFPDQAGMGRFERHDAGWKGEKGGEVACQ